MDLGLPLRKAVSSWGSCVPTLFSGGATPLRAASPRPPALDLRQDLVDHTVVGHHLAQGGVEALEQLSDLFALASQERYAHALANSREHRAPDRWDLADSDLTACLIQERLHVLEWHT